MMTTEPGSSAHATVSLLTSVSLVLGALTLAGLWNLRRLTSGTTLVASWRWACAAAAATTWVASYSCGQEFPLARYGAGILLLAPTVAAFGAKRPQNVAWQWVVLAFLALLALPAVGAWLYRPGGALQVDVAWQWLLAIVVGMGLANYLPTGRNVAAIAAAAAQTCWLGDQFPTWLRWDLPVREQIGLICACLAVWLASWQPRRSSAAPLDRLWLDFRDAFGVAWTVRFAEQFNATAARSKWPVRLNWSHISNEPGVDVSSQFPPAAQQCLENLLRRFVSRAWIEARMK